MRARSEWITVQGWYIPSSILARCRARLTPGDCRVSSWTIGSSVASRVVDPTTYGMVCFVPQIEKSIVPMQCLISTGDPMNLFRRTLLVAGLALGLAGGALAQPAPVKVGVIIPLSGGAGPQGQHVTQAIQAMAALINESGGVLGRPIEILVRDDEATPAVGVSRAHELSGQGVSVNSE